MANRVHLVKGKLERDVPEGDRTAITQLKAEGYTVRKPAASKGDGKQEGK